MRFGICIGLPHRQFDRILMMYILCQESEQQQASKNSYKRKRGRPRKLMIVPITAEGTLLCLSWAFFRLQTTVAELLQFCVTEKEQAGTGWKPDKATIKSCATGKASVL